MAIVLDDVDIFVGGAQLQTVANECKIDIENEALETTTYGTKWRTYQPSEQATATFTVSGFMPTTYAGSLGELETDFLASATPWMVVQPDTPATAGSVAWAMKVAQTQHSANLEAGALATFSLSAQGKERLHRGILVEDFLKPSAAKTITIPTSIVGSGTTRAKRIMLLAILLGDAFAANNDSVDLTPSIYASNNPAAIKLFANKTRLTVWTATSDIKTSGNVTLTGAATVFGDLAATDRIRLFAFRLS